MWSGPIDDSGMECIRFVNLQTTFKLPNCGLTLEEYGFADHHKENTWVNLELHGTLVMGHKNGWANCTVTFDILFLAHILNLVP